MNSEGAAEGGREGSELGLELGLELSMSLGLELGSMLGSALGLVLELGISVAVEDSLGSALGEVVNGSEYDIETKARCKNRSSFDSSSADNSKPLSASSLEIVSNLTRTFLFLPSFLSSASKEAPSEVIKSRAIGNFIAARCMKKRVLRCCCNRFYEISELTAATQATRHKTLFFIFYFLVTLHR